jgi:hypothetical protein
MGDKTRGNSSVNSYPARSYFYCLDHGLHVRCFVHFSIAQLVSSYFIVCVVSSMSLRCSTEVGDYVFLVAWLSVNIVLQSVFIIYSNDGDFEVNVSMNLKLEWLVY